MPRYKDSPEVRAAKQERREKLRELLTLMESEDVRDLKYVFKEIVRVMKPKCSQRTDFISVKTDTESWRKSSPKELSGGIRLTVTVCQTYLRL